MAQKIMTLGDIKSLVYSLVNAAAIADSSWTPAKESISGLINKIMKEVIIDGNWNDKLGELDGDVLPFGQAIEEYYTGLVPAADYNDFETSGNPEDALKPYRPTFDEVVYSERLGRKVFATTVDNEKYQVAFTNETEYANLINIIIKRLYDSLSQFKFGVKKELLGKLAAKAKAPAVAYTTNSTVIKAGHIYSQSSKYYISKKNFGAAVNKTLAQLVTDGDVIEITLKTAEQVSAVTDTASGEAFIEAVKKAVEDAQFVSEGTSISGSTIGAEEGLVLYLRKGVLPTLDVTTLSGSFHESRLAIPAEVRVVDDFGQTGDAAKIVALLVDPRGVKLHTNYQAVREEENGLGDYWTYFMHYQGTAYYSNHTFVKAFYTA